MYGRKITPNLRENTPNHLYLKGEHRGVWNEEALSASKEIILCEALIDALTFWVAGFRNVTASYGVNGFTAAHRAAFEKHGTERVYIAYDRDGAGDKAAAALAEELMRTGIECFRVEFPKGMDANEYALKMKPAAKSLGVLLNRASWLGKGQRPEARIAVPVMVREPVAVAPEIAAPAKEEPAAKEEISEESILAENEAENEAESQAEIAASAAIEEEPEPAPAPAASLPAIPDPVLP